MAAAAPVPVGCSRATPFGPPARNASEVFENGGVVCFTEGWRLVHASCDRLEADSGIELERTQLIGEEMLTFRNGRQPHPLDERFPRSQGER